MRVHSLVIVAPFFLGTLASASLAAADLGKAAPRVATCASTRCAPGFRCTDTSAGARCAPTTAVAPKTTSVANACARVRCAGGSACENGPRGARCVPVSSGRLSHVGQHLLNVLQSTAPQHRGRSWGLSQDNTFAADWMLFTPRLFGRTYSQLAQAVTCEGGPNCNTDFGLRRCRSNAECGVTGQCAPYAPTMKRPGMRPERLCVGHSDEFVQSLYQLMTSAERFVDLTSLTVPDGRYYAAIRNAITYLSYKPQRIVVRALFGSFPVQGVVKARDIVKDWTRAVRPGAQTRVYVGGYRSSNLPPSWNHSKIIAVDGVRVMSGGHNMWAKQYLGINPVNDLSMVLRGGAAAESHRFVNAQWAWTCSNFSIARNLIGQSRLGSYEFGALAQRCPPQFVGATPSSSASGVPVFSVGRLALIDPKQTANQGDTAILASIAAARRIVRIAQQDIGPPAIPYLGIPLGKWPAPLFNELGRALLRGVQVQLVVSNLNAKAGGLPITEATYSNGYSTKKVLQKLREHLQKTAGFPKDKALDSLLCAQVSVASWRYSGDKSYPNNEPIPNHSKTLVVDDTSFYIGSQNLYEAGLTEHGFIVDHAPTTQSYLQQYWAPLWRASAPTAVSGPGVSAEQCARALDTSFLTTVKEKAGALTNTVKAGVRKATEKLKSLLKR